MESNNPNKFWNMVNEVRTTKQSNYIDNIAKKNGIPGLRILSSLSEVSTFSQLVMIIPYFMEQ